MLQRRKLVTALGVLAGLLVVLAAVPALFRGRIEHRFRTEIAERVAARVDWSGARLTVLRSFPNLTLQVNDLTVRGIDRFAGDTLATIPRFRLVMGLGSVVRALISGDRLIVRSIALDRPALRLLVSEDGSRNWRIEREAARRRALEVSLRRLDVREATISLENRKAGLSLTLKGFRQSLAGDFSRDRFTVRSRARADSLSLTFGGVPYLRDVGLDFAGEVDADRKAKRVVFRKDRIRLNDLAIDFSGSAASVDQGTALDLRFQTPRTDFRHLLSLVPPIYAQDFSSLETSGTTAVAGRIKGIYGATAFPAFALKATVERGHFRYPDRALAARDISLDLSIQNPGGDLDRTVVELSRAHLVLGENPIDGALTIRTPVSDPDLDLRVAGTIELADVRRTLKLPRVEQLAGRISADLALRTRLSFIDQRRYERVVAQGGAAIRGLAVKLADRPLALMIDEADLRLTPHAVELPTFRGRIGSSDLTGNGRLDNLLGFALRNENLRGSVTVRSTRLYLDESQRESEWEEAGVIPVPARLDLAVQATVQDLRYRNLDLRNAHARVRVSDRRLILDEFGASLLGGEIGLTGFYETTDLSQPTVDVMVRMTGLEIPAAFTTLRTVRMLAPVARHARGSFSTDLGLSGALARDLTPLFETLRGRGSLETSQLVLFEFPALDRLSELLKIPALRSPALEPVRALLDVRDGRLHVRPFEARLAGFRITVAGSNGFDRSLDYTLRLGLPRALLPEAAQQVLANLLSKAGRVGLDLQAADTVELGVRLIGTVSDPSIALDAASLASSVEQAMRAQAAGALKAVEQRVEEATDAARQQLREQADRLIRDAEQRAAAVRDEAERLAGHVRLIGYAQADSLVTRAPGPVALVAAQLAADQLRKETDRRATQIVQEAGRRAEEIVADARQQAKALLESKPAVPPGEND